MRNHRAKDRSEAFRGGVLEGMSGFSVTLQNNRLGWIDIAPDYCIAGQLKLVKDELKTN
jgi:hypothetical protein